MPSVVKCRLRSLGRRMRDRTVQGQLEIQAQTRSRHALRELARQGRRHTAHGGRNQQLQCLVRQVARMSLPVRQRT